MKIIDCDSHFIVPEIYNYVSDHLKPLLPQLVFGHDGQLTEINYKIDPITNADAKFPNTLHCDLPGMSNILKRIEDLATMQVNKQLLTPQERAMRFNYSVEKNLAAEIAHSYNLITKQIVDTYPDKFFAAALLPLQDIDLALAELDWVIKNNFNIVYIDYTNYDSSIRKNIAWSSVNRIDEFFKVCEDNNIIIFMHFLMQHDIPFQIPEEIKPLNPDSMDWLEMSLYDLLTSGIFDRFPKLQLVVTEGAQKAIGKVLHSLYRLNSSRTFKNKRPYLEYFKNNMFCTIDIEMKESFNILMKYIGSDRLLFSTDYPHIDPSGLNKWNDTNDLYNAGLSQEDLENIAYRNAEKLFRIK